MVNPADMFLAHLKVLAKIRDSTCAKTHVDSLRLIQLGNLLNTSVENKDTLLFRSLATVETGHDDLWEASDLDVGIMIVNWWKAVVESDIAKIDRDVKAENYQILKWWTRVVENEISKLDEAEEAKGKTEVTKGKMEVPPVPFQAKIEELDMVLTSIKATRRRLLEAVKVLESVITEVKMPGSLVELGLQVVEEKGLVVEELPATLVVQVKEWPANREAILRTKIKVLAAAVVNISTII